MDKRGVTVMTREEEVCFVRGAFEALVDRGVADRSMLTPSTVTDRELNAFEESFGIRLPSLFRAYLMAYCYDFSVICAPVPVDGLENMQENCEKGLWWIELLSLPKEEPLKNLYGLMESFREVCTNKDLIGLSLGSIKGLVPIGEWDGILCLDLNDGSLCSFEQTVFDWKRAGYLDENGTAHGIKRLPDFRTLLELYFYGKYDKEYEKQLEKNNEEKPDYAAYIQK